MSNVNLGTSVKSLYLGRKLSSYTGVIIHTGLNSNGKEITYSAGNSSGYVLELDNPIGTQEMAYAILASLKLRSVSYQPFEADKALSDPAAEIGDGVTAGGKTGIIMSIETDLTPLMASDLSAPMEEELGHEFKYEPKAVREFKRESAYTRARLTVTQDEIRAEVIRATNSETTLSASISIQADRITFEVARATNSETVLSTRITQTADAITAEVNRASGAEGQLSSRITQNADAITSEVTRATGAEGTLSTRIDQRLDSITLSVSSSSGSSTFTIKDGSTTLDTNTLDLSVKAVNISGKLTVGQLADGSVVVSSQSSTEFYLSTSASSATGGSWSATMPTWESGKYLWVRTKTTDTYNDNTTQVKYSPTNGRYDKNLTTALSTASSAASAASAAGTAASGAQSTANSAVKRTGIIYKSVAASAGAPAVPTSWQSGTGDSQNAWTTKRPEYSTSYPDLYYTTQKELMDGTYSCFPDPPKLDATTTVIDGAHIITGSIAANKIAVTDLNAFGATIGGWTINQRSIEKAVSGSYDVYFSAPSSPSDTSDAFAVRALNAAGTALEYKFLVMYNGKVIAKNADIAGKITATSGEIGGFTIGAASIYNGMTSLSDTTHNGVYVGTDGIALGKGNFSVGSDGALSAKSGSIGGWSITSTYLERLSDTVRVRLNGTSIVSGNNVISVATRASTSDSWATQFSVTYGGAVTCKSGTIGGWTLSSTYLQKDTGTYRVRLYAPTSPTGTTKAISIYNSSSGATPFYVNYDGSVSASAVYITALAGSQIGDIPINSVSGSPVMQGVGNANVTNGINSGVYGGIAYNDATSQAGSAASMFKTDYLVVGGYGLRWATVKGGDNVTRWMLVRDTD